MPLDRTVQDLPHHLRLWLGATVIAAALGASPAGAQEAAAPPAALEEVVVTARKREESLQDAPLSIQAFTTAELEERGVESLADLSKFSPGITYNQGTSRFASDFSIRGMTQVSAPGDNRRDLVTVFIDGVPYIGNPSGIGSEDLQRVEVIKGPQSALFGRATFGGAISLITTTPGEEFKARVSATLAEYNDRRVSAAVEGPIVPGILAGRVIWDTSDFDGFYRNAFGGRLGESKQNYVAGTLALTPTENFSVKLRYGKRDDEDGPAATTLVARWPDHNCGPFPGFQPRALAGLPAGFTLEQARRAYCGELRAPDGAVGINTVLPTASIGRTEFDEHKLELEHELASGVVDWSFLNGHNLTAIVSTQDQQVSVLADFERAPEDRYQSYSINDQSQDSYELRFSSPAEQRFTWMVGLSRLEADFDVGGGFINGALFGPMAGGPPLPLVITRSGSETDSIYASVGFDVTDALNVSAEARRQEDTIISGIGTPTQFEVVTKATLPRLLVRYALTEQTNLYANYGEGNQPTQGYATFFQLTPAQQEVAARNGVSATAPEAEVENFEVGIKHRAADGRWYVNASLYYLEWVGRQGLRNLQIDLNGDGVITLVPAPGGEVFNAVPFAAGDSNTKGFELDGALSLTTNLTVGGSLAYADTEITKALNEPVPLRLFGITDSAGKQFPLVPEWSGAAFAQLEMPLGESRRWFVRGDTTYIGKRYDNIVNLAYVPGQWRANLRGGFRSDSWEVTAFVNNFFDDDTLEASRYNSDSAADPFFFQLVSSEAVLPNKRQVGITATFRF
jgi:iron complex outermembrane recepter protein